MAWLDIVVIGGSAGSIEAVTGLPHILGRSVPLPAQHATDGEPIEPGQYSPRSNEHHASHTGRVANWGANR
jgi:hypothetical protein